MRNLKMRIFLSIFIPRIVHGWGEGPIGIYSVDAETVLVGDSDQNAFFLVNVRTGGAEGKLSLDAYFDDLTFDPKTRTGHIPHLVGLTSCESCSYFLATYHAMHHSDRERNIHETIFKFDLKRPLVHWRDNDIGLENASISKWSLKKENGLRMLTLNKDGTLAYVADLPHGIWSFQPHLIGSAPELAAPELTKVAEIEKPRSVQLTGIPNELLVTGEYGVTIINLDTGETCTVEHEDWPHSSRDAVMDPTNEDTIIFFAANRLHELIGARKYCEDGSVVTLNITKRMNGNKGWLDGDGTLDNPTQFARPHCMTLMPSMSGGTSTELLLSDTDNGVLRMVQLDKNQRWRTSTIIYDYTNDRMENKYSTGPRTLAPMATPLQTQCPDSSWKLSTPDNNDNFCWKSMGKSRKWSRAKQMCKVNGGRLCTAFEVRIDQSKTRVTGFFANDAWTSFACNGCWHPFPRMCTSSRKGEKKAWRSGHMTAQVTVTSTGKRIIENRCRLHNKKRQVMCCADSTVSI